MKLPDTHEVRLNTTPESSKGSAKVNFAIKAVVVKSGERALTRF